MHITFLGSGSHSPFSIHVIIVGPLNTPEEQDKLKVDPSIAGLVWPVTTKKSSISRSNVRDRSKFKGSMHLAIAG